MSQHSIKARLDQGELVRVMCIGPFPDPKLVEVAGRYGELHGVWIDQEHSAIPHARMELLVMACRASGLDAFARVPPTDYATLMRPFEAGCSGVMVAQIRQLDEVHRVVQWSKYPPRGIRGLFLGNAESNYGRTPAAEHVAKANAERWLAIQIETPEAVEEAERKRREEAEARMRFTHAESSALATPEPAPQPGGRAPGPQGEMEKVETFVREDKKVGRNEPCPCGSGKKYKQCHGRAA